MENGTLRIGFNRTGFETVRSALKGPPWPVRPSQELSLLKDADEREPPGAEGPCPLAGVGDDLGAGNELAQGGGPWRRSPWLGGGDGGVVEVDTDRLVRMSRSMGAGAVPGPEEIVTFEKGETVNRRPPRGSRSIRCCRP